MDARCPRKLDNYPEEWCSFAVLRLKALRRAERELTEKEEANCPGCPWAIAHQLSSYCFFKYAKDFLNENNISDVEIASLNSISIDTVKKTEKKAIEKVKESDLIKSISSYYGSNGVLDSVKELDSDFSIIS